MSTNTKVIIDPATKGDKKKKNKQQGGDKKKENKDDGSLFAAATQLNKEARAKQIKDFNPDKWCKKYETSVKQEGVAMFQSDVQEFEAHMKLMGKEAVTAKICAEANKLRSSAALKTTDKLKLKQVDVKILQFKLKKYGTSEKTWKHWAAFHQATVLKWKERSASFDEYVKKASTKDKKVKKALGIIPKELYTAKHLVGPLAIASYNNVKNAVDDEKAALCWLNLGKKRLNLGADVFGSPAMFYDGYDAFKEQCVADLSNESRLFLLVMSALDRYLLEGNFVEYKMLYNQIYPHFIILKSKYALNVDYKNVTALLEAGPFALDSF